MIKKIFFLSSLLIPVSVFAFEYHISTPLPGIAENGNYDIGSFVANFFQLGLALVGITSFAFIIKNGNQSVIFSNSESKINDAREGIKQAIWGFLLLISSVVILDTINPCILQTVNFWKSREDINKTCLKSSSSVLPSITSGTVLPSKSAKDQLIENLIASGTEIQTLGPLIITGVIPDPANSSNKTIRRIKIQGNSSGQVGQYTIYGFTNNNPDSISLLKKIEEEIYVKDSQSIFNDFIDASSNDTSSKKPEILKAVKDFLISSSKSKFTSSGYYSSYNAKVDETNNSFSFDSDPPITIKGKTVTSGVPSSCSEIESGFLSCALRINVFVPAAEGAINSSVAQFYISSVEDNKNVIKGAFEYLVKNDPAIKNALNN